MRLCPSRSMILSQTHGIPKVATRHYRRVLNREVGRFSFIARKERLSRERLDNDEEERTWEKAVEEQ